jgi:parallel beta-helix repeat protein
MSYRSMSYSSKLPQRAFLFGCTLLIGSVTASAATLCVNPAGKPTQGVPCKSTIAAAVAAASAGDTILIEPGTYKEQVTITKPLSIGAVPLSHVVIDAAGKSNGIFINGLWATPNPGIANVVVTGLEVENANYEGILVVNATNVSLVDNHVHDNNKKLEPSSAMCPGIAPYETSEAMDCGEGIHLMAVDHSNITRNLVEDNSGGILITDETGPTWNNTVSGNIVRNNGYACGITMASHPAANASGPIKAVDYGIMHNVISHNQSYHNGLSLPGAGAGVGIFAPGPGATNTGNVVIGNDLHDNGLPGVTMHNHAIVPNAPPIFFNDNSIIGNHIHGNAADTADAATPGATGINVFSKAPMTGTVISQNTFDDEAVDIVFNAPAGSSLITHFNDFSNHEIGVDNLGSGAIDATENWWNSFNGPGPHAVTTTGPNVTTMPYLLVPFDINLDGY